MIAKNDGSLFILCPEKGARLLERGRVQEIKKKKEEAGRREDNVKNGFDSTDSTKS